MQVHVEFWGSLKRLTGESKRIVEIEGEATIATLARHLADDPVLRSALEKCAYSIGTEIVPLACALKEGDQVAVLPPVSGG